MYSVRLRIQIEMSLRLFFVPFRLFRSGNMSRLQAQAIRENNEHAFAQAEKLGIARLLNPDDMVTSAVPDRLAVMTYLHQLYHYFVESDELSAAVANSPSQPQPAAPLPQTIIPSLAPVGPSDSGLAPSPAALAPLCADVTASHSHQSVLGDGDWIIDPDSLPPVPVPESEPAPSLHTVPSTSRLSKVCFSLLLYITLFLLRKLRTSRPIRSTY